VTVNKVELIFPDTVRILAFIMECKVSGVEINSYFLKVTGLFTNDQVLTACGKYGAILNKSTPVMVRL
jgi:hypothetical protein